MPPKPIHAVRKPPPAPSVAAADDWVKGAQAPRRPGRAPDRPQDSRGTVRVGRDGVARKRVHAWIPAELERRLAVYCAEHDRELGHVVADALVKFIK